MIGRLPHGWLLLALVAAGSDRDGGKDEAKGVRDDDDDDDDETERAREGVDRYYFC